MVVGDHVNARDGSYVLEALIAQGGMGQVFQVRRERDGLPFALKCGLRGHAESVARESGVLTAFPEHPALPHVIASGQRSGEPWFIMPLLRGASVRELLSDVGNLPLPWVMDIMGTVCSALCAVHKVGPHRDLKPENVFITYDGRVSLLDFGIQQIGPEQVARLGTARYMSPEQLSSRPVDWRADLFAVGLLTFEMLLGIHPFDLDGRAHAPGVIEYRILNEEPAKIDALTPAMFKYVGRMCDMLLSKTPDERFVPMADVYSWCCRVKNQWHADHGDPEDLRSVFALRERVVRDKSIIRALGAGTNTASSGLVVVGTPHEYQKVLVESLEDMLDDDTCPATLRAEVIRALVQRGDVTGVSVLKKAQNDPDFQVRRLATLGVCRLSSFARASQ